MNQKAIDYIKKLQLKKHPEGGYYKEIYRAGEMIIFDRPDKREKKKRSYSTSIYFLLEGKQFSSFHKIKSDELWHFYDGSPVKIIMISDSGKLTEMILGKNLEEKQKFQFVVPKNTWFASELLNKRSFALVGCTVSPGFDFDDFELAKRDDLLSKFPQHSKIITALTRQ